MRPIQLIRKTRTRAELQEILTVSASTLSRRIKEIRERGHSISKGKLLSPREREIILKYCGFGIVLFAVESY